MKNTKINCILISTFLAINSVYGQEVSLIETDFEGREAYVLQNSNMRISMLSGGAYIAELSLLSTDKKESINPLFVPHYKTMDPHVYNAEKHKELYGDGVNGKLMAGYMGHYLCFPYFGGPNSEFERKLGSSTHGEAYTVQYEVEKEIKDESAGVTASAMLPISKYAINRSITLMPEQPVVLVEEEIENLESFDRPYKYVQHVTFGKPFIEYGKTFVDAPVSRIAYGREKGDPLNSNSVEWPLVRTNEGEEVNVGVFGSEKGEGGYYAWFMNPDRDYTWFTMYNKDFDLLVGYIFEKDENPWIGDWQENRRDQKLPRDGKVVAWGLEVGTSPFGSGIKQSIERGPVFETPTYRWIGAKEKKKQSYLIFLMEINDDFMGVKDLKLEEGSIILTEKETEKKIRIANGFSLPKD